MFLPSSSIFKPFEDITGETKINISYTQVAFSGRRMSHVVMQKLLFVLLCTTIFGGCSVSSMPYDYTSIIECLPEPQKPQYEGGMIRNAEFNNALEGWSAFGYGKIALKRSKSGNQFGVASNRVLPYHSISQKVYLRKDKLYTFSAWFQSSKPNTAVSVVFKTSEGFIHAGALEAQSGCWSMLKGGLTVTASGPAELYFETENSTAEIWVDSVSLQPFTEDQWRAHQIETINKKHKKTVRLQTLDGNGNILAGANISIQQTRSGFPFGCAIASTILSNTAYENWFTSRFTVTTFENEMKWYSNEHIQGQENYKDADAMFAFVKQHRISVRGHNVFWDDPRYQQGWIHSLNMQQLRDATTKRMEDVMLRYRGRVIAWDVLNENLHFSFYEDKLGGNFSTDSYRKGHNLDSEALLFLNDYNTLEQPGDPMSTPAKYLQKLNQIKSSSKGLNLAIGLEGHFSKPDLAYIRSSLDTLAAANVPIWLTEVDVSEDPNQAKYLEDILREAYAHPAVDGIVIWGAWHPEGCYRMCLTDNNFKNLPTGDVVDKLITEWKSGHVVGTTDADGFFSTQLLHGTYEVTISHPFEFINSTSVQTLQMDFLSQHADNILKIHV